MFKIDLLNKISPVGMELFNRNTYCWGENMENADAIMVRSASMHDLELDPNVKAIVRAGAGVNNIPTEDCAAKGVVVFNTPGANANAVKELVLLGLLMTSRKVAPSMEWVKTLKGQGSEVGKLVEKGKAQFVGPEIMGKTLGVIGLGAIGVLVANAATSLGMKVYGYDPYISIDAAWGLSQKVNHAKSLKEVYENSDYVSIHVPYNNETKGMINASSIAMMKNGVRILNFSRGELVDDTDIRAALDERKVAVYITDFPTDEQIEHKGIIALPHLGASTPESEDNCAKMAALQIMDFLENGNIKNSVNLPDASMAKSGDVRLCIIHKNAPAMLAKISTALSDNNLNIENMINKSRKDYAYSMFDIIGEISDDIMVKINGIEGIIKTRLIK